MFRMERLSIASGRARLAAERTGADVDVVFLHAGGTDRRMWRSQMNALLPRWTSLAYDRRGFGESPHVDESWSATGDLKAVLDAEAPGRPVVLVGCSQGGRIAIDFALAEPARVRALVLVAPSVSGAPQPESYPPNIQALLDAREAAERERDIERINAIEARLWLDGPQSDAGRIGGAPRELFLAMNRTALAAQPLGTEIEPPSAMERLGDLRRPTLLVWGDLDFPHIQQRCRDLTRLLPQLRSRPLRGVAHLPNLERPQEFNRVLLEFMNDFVPARRVPVKA